MTKSHRVLVVFGTRPEAIKMAPVVGALRKSRLLQSQVCVTSQHQEMLQSVLKTFQIVPDFDLNIMRPHQDLMSLSARLLDAFKHVLHANRPDLILVHGDTTSAMIAALSAYYLSIPVGHVEAGLRTYQKLAPFPEEINRQFIDRLADLLFAPTQAAVKTLAAERVDRSRIYLTGNTIVDAVMQMSRRAEEDATIVAPDGDFILVTGHRRENFGEGFESICLALREIAAAHPDVSIVYPVHLNPNVQRQVHRLLGKIARIRLMAPLDYLSFLRLMQRCRFLISDSGGVQEEACVLRKPVLLMREVTERPEAVEAGFVKIVGTDRRAIVENAGRLLQDAGFYRRMTAGANPYGNGAAAQKIVAAIERFISG